MALNFDLTDEQQMLRKMVRSFAEKEIAPIAQELDDREEFSFALTKRMGELGLFGPYVPEEYGGSNMGYLSYIIATEEIARIDGSQAATLAAGNSLGISPIYYYGNEDQRKAWLPDLCAGKALSSFGLTEPNAGSDAGASKTTAVLEGDHWVVNGSKIFITNSATTMSKVCVVQAVTGKRKDGRNEISCILVPNGTPGFEAKAMHGKMVWRASNTGELYFEGLPCPQGKSSGPAGRRISPDARHPRWGQAQHCGHGSRRSPGGLRVGPEILEGEGTIRQAYRRFSGHRFQIGGHGHGDRAGKAHAL